MALTAGGIWYPTAGEPFPSASWWLTHAESEDARFQSGIATVTATAGQFVGNWLTVTFAQPFAAVPRVVTQLATGGAGFNGVATHITNVAANEFWVNVGRSTALTLTSYPVHWIAMRA